MPLELRGNGHPFHYLQALSEATSSERVGEPSQLQARLVKFFLVVFLHTVPGALSFLLCAEEFPQDPTYFRQSSDRHARFGTYLAPGTRDLGREVQACDTRA